MKFKHFKYEMVDIGHDHSIFVKSDGSLWGMGNDMA